MGEVERHETGFTHGLGIRLSKASGAKYSTLVKRGASIGANATVVCGNTLGRYCLIGSGAVVTHDVPDYALVYGTPAKLHGWMCGCGIKLDFAGGETATCAACGADYRKEGLTVEPAIPAEAGR